MRTCRVRTYVKIHWDQSDVPPLIHRQVAVFSGEKFIDGSTGESDWIRCLNHRGRNQHKYRPNQQLAYGEPNHHYIGTR